MISLPRQYFASTRLYVVDHEVRRGVLSQDLASSVNNGVPQSAKNSPPRDEFVVRAY